jgi:hypothetical protein
MKIQSKTKSSCDQGLGRKEINQEGVWQRGYDIKRLLRKIK